MLAYFYCRNHANQLAISNIVTTAGIFTGGPLSLLNNLYCCSHFFIRKSRIYYFVGNANYIEKRYLEEYV